MKFWLSIITLAATWSAWAQGSSEAIVSYTYTVSGTANAAAGWTFQTAATIAVTDLGCFADVFVNNPSLSAVQVGLWAPDGTLLASDSVSPTNALVNQTRYGSITPTVLSPGIVYSVGVYGGGTIGLDIPGLSASDSISNSPTIIVGGLALATSGFSYPMALSGTQGAIYGGPNFRYQGAVPEPNAYVLIGLGGLAFAVMRSRRRNLAVGIIHLLRREAGTTRQRQR